MKRIGLLLCATGTLLLAHSAGARSAEQDTGKTVDVIELDGVIDPTTSDFLADTMESAIHENAELIVIQLDTPGGLDVSMREMVDQILSSPSPVAVWVGPPGARAASAGVFLVYASHIAAMAPATNLGAAHPVNLGGGLSGAAEEKAVSDAAAFLRSLAEERGRPVEFAEAAVRESAALSAREAFDEGVVEHLAISIPDLLGQLDGTTVETVAGTRTLDTAGDRLTVRIHEMGPLRRILHAVSNPTVAFLLLTLGFWAIVFELSQPGIGIAGFGGAVSVVLAFYALAVLPVNLAGLMLLLLGMALFTIDVMAAGLGVFTVGGALAFGAGSFLLFAGVSPAIRVSPWLISAMVVSSVLFFGFVMTVAIRSRNRRVLMGQEGLIGLIGQARADLEPEGHVWVKGALWKARAMSGPIPEGSSVRVRRVDGLLLLVQREEKEEES